MERTTLRVVLHAGIFIASFMIFALGMGVGLAVNPAASTLLWMVAGVIAVGNVVCIIPVGVGTPTRGLRGVSEPLPSTP